jgi:hypothetical protein
MEVVERSRTEKTVFHAETFDNFKNPLARFEGPGSIFRERLEPRMNTDAHDKSEDTGMGSHVRSAGSFHGFRVAWRDVINFYYLRH